MRQALPIQGWPGTRLPLRCLVRLGHDQAKPAREAMK